MNKHSGLFQETPDASEGGQGEAGGGCYTRRSPTWEEVSLMNGMRAIKVTLTKRQEVRLSSGGKEVY